MGDDDAALNAPLPCTVQIGPVRFQKGLPLRVLVNAARRWHAKAGEAFEQKIRDANDDRLPTPEDFRKLLMPKKGFD